MKTNLGINTSRCNKKIICSLSLVLMLAMTLITALAQPGLAQVDIPQPEKTVGYISVAPTLVGVGQTATVNLWVFPLPNTYAYLPYWEGFTGVTVTFVKPDGSEDSFMPVDGTGMYDPGQTQSLGAIYFFYTPDMAGNWSVSFTMPEQNVTDSSGTVIYKACTSNTASFTVQTDPVDAGLLNGYPWAQLPNENTYWTYPINSNNREWSAISGDWLGSYFYGGAVSNPTCRLWQPYGSGPNTAHITWRQEYITGGLIGGAYGSLSYIEALAAPNTVIMSGKAYVNIPRTANFKCIDLTTGETLYTAPGQISYGIHLPGNVAAQSFYDASVSLGASAGSEVTAWLFGTDGGAWNYYDAATGNLLMKFENTSVAMPGTVSPVSGFNLVDGTTLAYLVVGEDTVLAWDLSKAASYVSFGGIYASVTTRVGDFRKGIIWNVTVPKIAAGRGLSVLGVSTDGSTVVIRDNPQRYWGFSTKDGTMLWNFTLTYPVVYNEQITLYGVDDFIIFDPTETTFKCYSMLTGRLLWTSPSYADSPWATTWTVYFAETNDYENLYLAFPDGTISALSLATGKELWRSEAILSTEFPNNAVPYVCGMVMVGGNIYVYGGYSILYQINPMPRFSTTVCVNATTGDITWTLNGGIFPSAAANGYVLGFGRYDGNLYCLGKGQTSTSVTIQNNVVTNHATALITGNVLDQSPAQAGTPAVADASMSEWMDYLHMQNSTLLNNPPQTTGVPVTLTAVDSNGNTITIGTTTTDSAGNYGINFVPEITGMYTITASFAGTNSYWPSTSGTKLTVVEAPQASATSAPIANPPYELYTIGMGLAIIIALAIAVLLLRKRP